VLCSISCRSICGACIFRRRGGVFLILAGPRRARRARSIKPLPTKTPPKKKTAPAARPGAKVSAAPPGAPQRGPRASPDHPTWWLAPPGGVRTMAMEAKKQPNLGPGCSHQNQSPNQKTAVYWAIGLILGPKLHPLLV
jgi:hypothetical protein